MNKNIIGLAIICFGAGMITAKFIPWWGVIGAIIIIVCGVIIIYTGGKC